MMSAHSIDLFDTVIHGGTVATASDTALCDVGIRNGKIAALARTCGDDKCSMPVTGLFCPEVSTPIAIWISRVRRVWRLAAH